MHTNTTPLPLNKPASDVEKVLSIFQITKIIWEKGECIFKNRFHSVFNTITSKRKRKIIEKARTKEKRLYYNRNYITSTIFSTYETKKSSFLEWRIDYWNSCDIGMNLLKEGESEKS